MNCCSTRSITTTLITRVQRGVPHLPSHNKVWHKIKHPCCSSRQASGPCGSRSPSTSKRYRDCLYADRMHAQSHADDTAASIATTAQTTTERKGAQRRLGYEVALSYQLMHTYDDGAQMAGKRSRCRALSSSDAAHSPPQHPPPRPRHHSPSAPPTSKPCSPRAPPRVPRAHPLWAPSLPAACRLLWRRASNRACRRVQGAWVLA